MRQSKDARVGRLFRRLPAPLGGKRALSATAPGELAEPGRDRLLVAPGRAPARRARLARRDRVGLGPGGAAGCGGLERVANAEPPRPRSVLDEGHRARHYRALPARTRTN